MTVQVSEMSEAEERETTSWEDQVDRIVDDDEERDAGEVAVMEGMGENGVSSVRLMREESRAANYAFDVTPARLVTGLITERGVCAANEEGIREMFRD